jgi:hypothetical protein
MVRLSNKKKTIQNKRLNVFFIEKTLKRLFEAAAVRKQTETIPIEIVDDKKISELQLESKYF